MEQGPDKRRREVVAEGQGVEICPEWQRYGGCRQETSGIPFSSRPKMEYIFL